MDFFKGKGDRRKYTDEYVMVKELGKGAFATVYLAYNKEGRRAKYAAKVANKYATKNMFADEVAAMKKVGNADCLVNLVDFFDRDMVLILEFAPGGELFDNIIKREKYSEVDAADCVCQMLQAVDYMHQKGVAHRDLKPENVLLSKDKTRILITDFGLAKTFDLSAHSPTFHEYVGTEDYMATEMLKSRKYPSKYGQVKYGPNVDEFAIGIIAYILLTGYPPWWEPKDKYTCKITWDPAFWSRKARSGADLNYAKDLIKQLANPDAVQRLSARTAMKHKWFTKKGVDAIPLEDRQPELRKTMLYARMRGAIAAVKLTQRLAKVHIQHE